MKVSKDARKLSRSLFRSSFTGGRLDRARVNAVLEVMAARTPRHTLETLKDYERLVRMELARRHALIESATPLEPSAAEAILRDLKSRFGDDITHETKVNPALLGGIRVQLGSQRPFGAAAQQTIEGGDDR